MLGKWSLLNIGTWRFRETPVGGLFQSTPGPTGPSSVTSTSAEAGPTPNGPNESNEGVENDANQGVA